MSSMLSFTVKMEVQHLFFDRKAIQNAVARGERRGLSRHAGAIRLRARRSLKRVSKAGRKKADRARKKQKYKKGKFKDPTISKPGKPPKIHSSGDMNPKKILYYFDQFSGSAIVGPVRFNTRFNAVQALEFGGRVPIYKGSRRKRKLVRMVTIRPRPFMRPAEEAERAAFEKRMADHLMPG
ncbi:MAG: hypothetical protein COA78_24745 [Blastopirellula sp.]|nr:MAG: hypothetical protein COA78_24745 [Blastopirellula sp.]